MAENEPAEVAEKEDEEAFAYDVTVDDIGPAAKRVSVEIPHERIDQKLKEKFKELRQQAAIPGFRTGHAPRKLIERRFSADVKEQVRRSLISESYEQAVEKNSLQVIGEPEFDNPDAIKLPKDGPLTYSFQVEVQPNITLPDLSGLKIRKPKLEISEANVDQAMANLREQQGTLVPIEDRAAEPGDYLTADIHVKVDGNVVTHQHDAQIVLRPGRFSGIQVDDLDQQLAGLKVGEQRTLSLHAPDEHPNEALRGKDVQAEVSLKDIKKLELPEMNAAFLNDLGFNTEQELRAALREQMDEKIGYDIKQAMRDQVNRFLLDNVQIELPTKLSDRQADRVLSRKAVDLIMKGIPREQAVANVEQLRGGAKEEVARDLKLFFILQKVAADQKVSVDEAELNGRIAMLAAQRGARPEKVKQEMTADGNLSSLYLQMLEQKAVDRIIEKAEIEEVEVPAEEKK